METFEKRNRRKHSTISDIVKGGSSTELKQTCSQMLVRDNRLAKKPHPTDGVSMIAIRQNFLPIIS